MTQTELSRRMARPLKTISEIATGKAAITPDTAIQLERALGVSAAMWLGLESRYREARARERDQAELEGHVAWLQKFPKRELIERGIIRRRSPETRQAADLLTYFGVSSPSGWEQFWGSMVASYRMSERLEVSGHALSVWLREAEREVEGIDLPPYDPDGLRNLVPRIRLLSKQHVAAAAIEEARDELVGVGVGLLLVKGIRGAPASGAVRWIRNSPWILLTLRHKTDDHFWFSLFHEIGHLVQGGRRGGVLEELLDEDRSQCADEDSANEFAREALLPGFDSHERWSSGAPNRTEIREVAAEYGVAPGIVVGRLERDGRLSHGQFRDLKRPIGPSA